MSYYKCVDYNDFHTLDFIVLYICIWAKIQNTKKPIKSINVNISVTIMSNENGNEKSPTVCVKIYSDVLEVFVNKFNCSYHNLKKK